MKYTLIGLLLLTVFYGSFSFTKTTIHNREIGQTAQIYAIKGGTMNAVHTSYGQYGVYGSNTLSLSSEQYASIAGFVRDLNQVTIPKKQNTIRANMIDIINKAQSEKLRFVVTFELGNRFFKKTTEIKSLTVYSSGCLQIYTSADLRSPVSTPTVESLVNKERKAGGICAAMAAARSLESLGVVPTKTKIPSATNGFKDPKDDKAHNVDILNHMIAQQHVSASDTQFGSIQDQKNAHEKAQLDDKKIKCEIIKIDGVDEALSTQIEKWCKKVAENPKVNGHDKYDYTLTIAFRNALGEFDNSAHVEKAMKAEYDKETGRCKFYSLDTTTQSIPNSPHSGSVPYTQSTNIFEVDLMNSGIFVAENNLTPIPAGLNREQLCCTIDTPVITIPESK